jgi:hypothetical protein
MEGLALQAEDPYFKQVVHPLDEKMLLQSGLDLDPFKPPNSFFQASYPDDRGIRESGTMANGSVGIIGR